MEEFYCLKNLSKIKFRRFKVKKKIIIGVVILVIVAIVAGIITIKNKNKTMLATIAQTNR